MGSGASVRRPTFWVNMEFICQECGCIEDMTWCPPKCNWCHPDDPDQYVPPPDAFVKKAMQAMKAIEGNEVLKMEGLTQNLAWVRIGKWLSAKGGRTWRQG